jgi:hypothetical protein
MVGNRHLSLKALRGLRHPRDERAAARAERRAEEALRRERDNQWSAERRAAAIEAESRRERNVFGR